MRTRPERDPQQMAHCVQSIPCEFGETGRPLAVLLREHRHNLREDLTEKSNLVQHACEEGRRVGWNERRILDVESNSRYRKYRQSAHIAYLTHPISHPSLDFSHIVSIYQYRLRKIIAKVNVISRLFRIVGRGGGGGVARHPDS
jgi:hypothetical protein